MKFIMSLIYAVQAIRHLSVLNACIRTRRDLKEPVFDSEFCGNALVYIVVPLLEEQAAVLDIFNYFLPQLDAQTRLVLVTSERERVVGRPRVRTTKEVIDTSVRDSKVIHLHDSNITARKGDQLNYAARALAENISDEVRAEVLFLIYDADSKPELNSLSEFRQQAFRYPEVPIFQQSARFSVPENSVAHPGTWHHSLLEAGALRANRFVLSYEWPRLQNRSPGQPFNRRISSRYVFGNVAGHGLCLRLSWLLAHPFPEATVMEDLEYSYGLAVANVPVIPLRALDRSEVPPSAFGQFKQSERWFLGPARVHSYRNTVGSQSALRPTAITISAGLISLEWLSCALAPALLLHGLRRRQLRPWTIIFLSSYTLQLVVADHFQEPDSNLIDRIRRLACYPVANCIFGAGGWSGAWRLVTRRSVADKTRRDV